jgi:hypothetical protein
MYGTFTCKARYTDPLKGLELVPEPDESSGKADGCAVPFAELLSPMFKKLPSCPHCGGLSTLLDVLEPVAG